MQVKVLSELARGGNDRRDEALAAAHRAASLVEKAPSRRRQHMARERTQCSSRLAGRRRDRVPLALVAEMQERHEDKREGGEGRR
jgi:hypothetical protein